MKIIPNKHIPLKGYKLLTVYPFLFTRRGVGYTADDLNHEEIHARQQKEMLLLFFYLWYLIEWLIRLIQYRNAHKAYRNISFEREAYAFQSDELYLIRRKKYSFINFL
ncbi:MAG: hypothetical protein KBT34_10770 [Prevotella sp.]|nr:hypothetical protein [Candidatus Prevotella equi]